VVGTLMGSEKGFRVVGTLMGSEKGFRVVGTLMGRFMTPIFSKGH